MRVAYLGPAGTFSEDALRAAAAAPRSSRCPRRRSTTRSPRSTSGVPTARWSRSRTRSRAACARRSTRSPSTRDSVAIVGEHDHPISNSLIAAREIDLDAIEAVYLAPAGERPVQRASSAPKLPSAEVRSASSTAEAVRTVAECERAVGSARRAVGGGDLRRRRPARRGRGRGRQRHPLRLARAGGHGAGRQRPVENHAQLLRARCRPPRARWSRR